MDDIPGGHAAVPVNTDNNGTPYQTRTMAGSVGICVTSSRDILDKGRSHNDSCSFIMGSNGEHVPYVVQPVSGWWVYVAEVAEGESTKNGELEIYLESAYAKMATPNILGRAEVATYRQLGEVGLLR
jgi:hypothetical protein